MIMRRALAHPVYRRLLVAQVVALVGTGLATVALGLLAYRLEGGAAGEVLGTAFAIKMLAYVLVAPTAVALLERLPRRAVLIGADVARLGVAVALPFVTEAWQVYLLVALMQAASATFTPTFQAVIPDVLLDEDDYTAALSLSRLAYDLEAVLSPVLAAVLLLVVPAGALFAGTAVGFAGSALLVLSVVLPPRDAARERTAGSVLRRIRRGTDVLLGTPALRPVLAVHLAVAAAGSFVLVQTVVIVREVLGRGDLTVALLLAAVGAGSVAVSLGLPRVLRRHTERRVMLSGAVTLAGAAAVVPAALAAAPGPGALLLALLWFVVGAGWAAAETPVGRLVRREVAPADRPAVFAAQFSLSHACWLLTYPLAGWLGARDLVLAAAVLAVVAVAAVVAAWVLWRSGAAPPVAGSSEDVGTSRTGSRPQV